MTTPSAHDLDAYRATVRAFIAERAPVDDARDGYRVPDDARAESAVRGWYRDLYGAGFLGAAWPSQWGGREDHHPLHDLILMEELVRARAPRPLDQVQLAAHALLTFGTEKQKRTYLPKIRAGEAIWCQLFSEPGAGSDLAALRTRATRTAEGFRVDGQKVWSTDAQWADYGLLLARSDPESERHRGLTAFVVRMDAPGLEIKPLREMTGSAEFCEVFLDGLQLGDDDVLGGVDNGWTVVNSGLASERSYVGANAVQLAMMHADLVELAENVELADGSSALAHPAVQHKIGELYVQVKAVQAVVRDIVDDIVLGRDDPSDGPIAKVAYTELNVAMCTYAMDLCGSADRLRPEGEAVWARWGAAMLWSRALTISGGSSEIMRGLIARNHLGLPRSW